MAAVELHMQQKDKPFTSRITELYNEHSPTGHPVRWTFHVLNYLSLTVNC